MIGEPGLSHENFWKRLGLASANTLALVLTGPVLAYYLCYYLGGREFWLIDLVGVILPWLFLPVIPLLLLALWLRRRFQVVLAGLCALLFALTYGGQFLPALPNPVSGPMFTVMSYNVLFSTTMAEPILAEIEKHDPDIIALQEMESAKFDSLHDHLAAAYPFHSAWERQGLFSRFPIGECHTLQAEGRISGWVHCCEIEIHGRPVSVYNLHARPPLLMSGQFMGLPVFNGVDKSKNYKDLKKLFDDLETAHGPVIVLGDFNMGERDKMYDQLQERLLDAYRTSGWGLGFTYTRWRRIEWPIWRIDYIWYSTDFVSKNTWLGEFSTSDHRPVIARLGFAGE